MTHLCEKLTSKKEKLAVIGLGYVGLPLGVAHDKFKEINIEKMETMFGKHINRKKVLIDVRGMLNRAEIVQQGYRYWRP